MGKQTKRNKMKKLLFTLTTLISLNAFSQTEWLYRENYYSFDVGLRGDLLIDRYGFQTHNFTTLTGGIEIKDMLWVKGFAGLNKDIYAGAELSYNATYNVEGQIDVILGTQIGHYRDSWGIGYSQIQNETKYFQV